MARRRSNYSLERDANAISRRRLLPDYRIPTALSLLSLFARPLEDRRSFHPEGVHRRPASFGPRSDGSITLSKSSRPADVFRFNVPERVVTCVRREMRREVLFANRKTGKGSRSRKSFNVNSSVSCKR